VHIANVRRSRLALAALVTLVAAACLGAACWFGAQQGSRRVRNELAAAARVQVASTLAALVGGEAPTAADTWIVDPSDGSSQALGDTSVEPPLQSLANDATAGGGEALEAFSQGGSRQLALAQVLGDGRVIVAVVDRASTDEDLTALRVRFALLAIALTAIVSVIAWLVLGRAMRPARDLLADRGSFLADAAHELRTPLSIIQASASQALSRPRATDDYTRSLMEIRGAAERASTAVNQLLDLARLESGATLARLAPLRLDLLAEEVAVSVRVDGVTITSPEGPSVVVMADMPLLRQALENVVRNAALRAQHVEVRTTLDDKDGVIEISDNGPGIDPDQVPKLFQRFRRGDTRGSVGLGLAIVRAIVTAHGGEIEVRNQDGGGAVFRLKVPLAPGGQIS
jgi:signal transduction histidine kinase